MTRGLSPSLILLELVLLEDKEISKGELINLYFDLNLAPS